MGYSLLKHQETLFEAKANVMANTSFTLIVSSMAKYVFLFQPTYSFEWLEVPLEL